MTPARIQAALWGATLALIGALLTLGHAVPPELYDVLKYGPLATASVAVGQHIEQP